MISKKIIPVFLTIVLLGLSFINDSLVEQNKNNDTTIALDSTEIERLSNIKTGNEPLKPFFILEQEGSDTTFLYEDSYVKRWFYKSDSTKIGISLFIINSHSYFEERYITVINKTLDFIDSTLGLTNVSYLDFIERKVSETNLQHEDKHIVDFNSNTVSFSSTGYPELTIIKNLIKTRLIIGGKEKNDINIEITARYLAKNILYNHFEGQSSYFEAAGFFPVRGFSFLKYNEVPIIYSLADYRLTKETSELQDFYNMGSVNTIEYLYNNRESYQDELKEVIPKMVLLLRAFENKFGPEKIYKGLSKYYADKSDDNIYEYLNEYLNNEAETLLNLYYRTNSDTDLSIPEITQIDESTYKIYVQKKTDAPIPCDLWIYTEDETIKLNWNGIKYNDEISFHTNKELLGAELDPQRVYILDKNWINNSFLLNEVYWSSWSISIRWFFWIQNALMIMGSMG